MMPIFIESYDALPINVKEVLRYLYCKAEEENLLKLIDECVLEVHGKLTPKVCYSKFSVSQNEHHMDLGFAKCVSEDLRKYLADCQEIVLFCATVGLNMDRLIEKYSYTSPVKAAIMQAIGAEQIESLCNSFCTQIEGRLIKQACEVKQRVSPGYGDIPLTLQHNIFNALECNKKIGVTLNDSYLMSPTKSVSAIIGIIKNGE